MGEGWEEKRGKVRVGESGGQIKAPGAALMHYTASHNITCSVQNSTLRHSAVQH